MEYMKPPPMLISIAQACDRLSISRRSFYRLMETGQIQTVKVGCKRMVAMSALKAFVQRLQQEATQ